MIVVDVGLVCLRLKTLLIFDGKKKYSNLCLIFVVWGHSTCDVWVLWGGVFMLFDILVTCHALHMGGEAHRQKGHHQSCSSSAFLKNIRHNKWLHSNRHALKSLGHQPHLFWSYVRNHETFNSLSFLSGTRIVQQAPGSVFSVTGGYALKYTPPIQHPFIYVYFTYLSPSSARRHISHRQHDESNRPLYFHLYIRRKLTWSIKAHFGSKLQERNLSWV